MPLFQQDLLISGNEGVATVWLLATLGSRFSHSKITKKKIEEVSIPEACQTISNSDLAIPLRQSSSLLYGVALVYKQKTDYSFKEAVLAKAQLSRDLLSVTLRNNPLLQYSNNAINNQHHPSSLTVLPDDPNFHIDTGLVGNIQSILDGNVTDIIGRGYSLNLLADRCRQIAEFDMQHNVDSNVNDANESSIGNTVVTGMTSKTAETSINDNYRHRNREVDIDMFDNAAGFMFDADGNAVDIINSQQQNRDGNVTDNYSNNELDEFVQLPPDLDFDLENNPFDNVSAMQDKENEVLINDDNPQQSNIRNKTRKVRVNKVSKKIQTDRNIFFSINQMKEFRDDYIKLRNQERDLNKKLQDKTLEMFTESMVNLPFFNQLAIQNLFPDFNFRLPEIEKRRQDGSGIGTLGEISRTQHKSSRASSVSSIEEARRALINNTTRRSSGSSGQLNLDEQFGDANPDFMDFNLESMFEGDNAVLDITFPGEIETEFDNEDRDPGAVIEESDLQAQASFKIGDGYDDLRNALRIKRKKKRNADLEVMIVDPIDSKRKKSKTVEDYHDELDEDTTDLSTNTQSLKKNIDNLDLNLKGFYEFLTKKAIDLGEPISMDSNDEEIDDQNSLNIRQFTFQTLVPKGNCNKKTAVDCFHRLLHLNTKHLVRLGKIGVHGRSKWDLLTGENISITVSCGASD